MFTPADIELAFRSGCQRAFERSVSGETVAQATIDDYLAAVHATRPTVSRGDLEQFESDIELFARL
jgi:transitional endoplasmic reticulum ATPase